MTSTLVYRRPCEHGYTHFHTIDGTHSPCDGKIDLILDPDKVLYLSHFSGPHTVTEILAALDGATE